MDRRVKLALALAVLLFGATVAMLFRRPASPPQANQPAVPNQPVIRSWTDAPKLPVHSPSPAAEVAQAPPAHQPQALIRASLEKNELPPRLPRVYPRPDDTFPEEPAVEDSLAELPESRPAFQIHIVAEGDTLPLLAERYLGSADRAMEIFVLNRAVLAAPDALRIGDELKIPPRKRPAKKDDSMLPERSLVPVQQ